MNSNTQTEGSFQSAAKLDLSIMPRLAFSNDGGSLPDVVLDAPRTTVGRAPGNSIVLEDDAISGEHAEIVLRNGTFMLRDLGSSNGTKLNAEPIVEAELKDGDRISFGSVECVYTVAGGSDQTKTTMPSTVESESFETAGIGDSAASTSAMDKAGEATYCTACGSENPQHASFCGRCGSRIGSVAPPLPSRPHSFDAVAAGATAGRVLNGMAQRLTNFAGVDPLQGLSGREFFSEALKKRTDDDIEDLFITGTSKTTPPLAQVDTHWPIRAQSGDTTIPARKGV